MSSVLRVNQLNNRVGLGTITITDQGQTLSGITTASEIRTNQIRNRVGLGTITITDQGQTLFSGSIIPGTDATQDLGSSSSRWANIYSADLQLSNEGSKNDVDGTWGKYTIQEGENDLFLINRITGKKYKFLLEEVK